MIEKKLQLINLFDYYQVLLTEKQRNYFQRYYEDDMSLSEIAEIYSVSRNAVYDQLNKVETALLDYEDKLNMSKKHNMRQKIINKLKETKNLDYLEELEEL